MPAKAGYLDHEVILNLSDAGCAIINAHGENKEAAMVVLGPYRHNDKVVQATKLLGAPQSGIRRKC